SDTSPIALVRAAMAHFQRLGLVLAEQARGEPFDGAVRRLRPPVHFSRLQSFRMQAQRWNAEKVLRALDLLLETEALCKTTAVPVEAVFGRAMFNVAAMARG
ncbi:MAG: DNA polymerase III subunit delta, partial [Alphaproteobacteria bacterium]|nr:DNA polymerase III subunit delta [Alphaproteobacteria bacterium]